MIKKLTTTSLITLSLLLVSAQAEGMKSGAEMMNKVKEGKQLMQKEKMHKMKMDSPFLIKHGLPHMTKMIMKNWDDKKLALTDAQKEKLLLVRKETMGAVMKLKPEVIALKKEVVLASKAGTKVTELRAKVVKLAALQSEATLVHLTCLDKTKSILSTEQYTYLLEKTEEKHEESNKKI